MQKFGEHVRAARQKKELTLSALAKKTSTFKGYISMIECSRTGPPSPKMVGRLCKVLDLDLERMLALSVFEKFPKGLRYRALEALLIEANTNGQTEAPGRVIDQS